MKTLTYPPPAEWATEANCKGAEYDVFFAPDENDRHYDWTRARALCGSCPVQAECLRDALLFEQRVERSLRWRLGFVGGLTAADRIKFATLVRKAGVSLLPPKRRTHGTYSDWQNHCRLRPQGACPACTWAKRDYEESRKAA